MDAKKVVVGIDTSTPSLAALRWAAGQARRHDAELQVLFAYHWRMPGAHFVTSAELEKAADELATLIVDEAVAEARELAPGLAAYGAAVLGSPARVLLNAAADATLLVVGHRGRGGFTSLLAGSVGVAVATHAPCPVAVVRGRADTATGGVVVGVDGSPSADHAIGLAFAEAAARGCGLVAVTAYTEPVPPWTADLPPIGYDPAAVRASLHEELVRHVAGWRDRYPGVPVAYTVEAGSTASVLTDQSRQAQLVVVGTRGRGGFAGLLLGSVGQQLLHHADCPVLIARGPTLDPTD